MRSASAGRLLMFIVPPKPLPEFGSADDFQLRQALNQLQGKPVQASKTMTERKPDEAAPAE